MIKKFSEVLPSEWEVRIRLRLLLPKIKEIRTLVNVRQINYYNKKNSEIIPSE
jgi:hypothetical protein